MTATAGGERLASMVLVLGVVALVVVIAGVAVVLAMATRQAREEAAPESHPGDYVAPVSSGGYRWRHTDESPDEFHARVDRENDAGVAPK